jgi:hypothetical protein
LLGRGIRLTIKPPDVSIAVAARLSRGAEAAEPFAFQVEHSSSELGVLFDALEKVGLELGKSGAWRIITFSTKWVSKRSIVPMSCASDVNIIIIAQYVDDSGPTRGH